MLREKGTRSWKRTEMREERTGGRRMRKAKKTWKRAEGGRNEKEEKGKEH